MTATTMLLNDNVLLTEAQLNLGNHYRGKVRDCYTVNNKLILITTDRLSAFDRILCSIRLKAKY
jgi:phosphoribosylaminoimidazole-succinocarboxamide synthase